MFYSRVKNVVQKQAARVYATEGLLSSLASSIMVQRPAGRVKDLASINCFRWEFPVRLEVGL